MAQTKTVAECLFVILSCTLCRATSAGHHTHYYSRILGDSAIGFGSVNEACKVEQRVISNYGSCFVTGSFVWTDPTLGQTYRVGFETDQNGLLRILPHYRGDDRPSAAPGLPNLKPPTNPDPCAACQSDSLDPSCSRCSLGPNTSGGGFGPQAVGTPPAKYLPQYLPAYGTTSSPPANQ